MNGVITRRSRLPPLPRSVRARLVEAPDDLDPWSGASGPFWRPPRAVVQPATADEVPAVVSWARRHGLALTPRGAGTGMPGGNVGPHVVLDLTSLDEIQGLVTSTEPGEATEIRAQPGAVAADLASHAAAAGLELPALPSSARWCTVGGMLACNAAGARSLFYGPARAWVTELRWVRADGRVERLARKGAPSPEWAGLADRLEASLPSPLPWPQVRKNSSGYALDAFLDSRRALDLAVGSEGTLGVITEATLQLHRPPESRAVLLVGVPKLDALGEVAQSVAALASVVACEYFGRRLVELGGLEAQGRLRGLSLAAGMLLVEVAGDAGVVDRTCRELRGLGAPGGVVIATEPQEMEALWGLRHAASPTLGRAREAGRRSTQFIEDSVVPVESLGTYVRELTAILRRHDTDAVLFGHAGQGNLHVNPLVDLREDGWRDRVEAILLETVDLVAELGGTLAGEHGDGRLRTPFLGRTFAPEVVAAFRTVKEVLDPDGLLNPGVKVPLDDPVPLAGLGDAPGFPSGSQGPERLERGR